MCQLTNEIDASTQSHTLDACASRSRVSPPLRADAPAAVRLWTMVLFLAMRTGSVGGVVHLIGRWIRANTFDCAHVHCIGPLGHVGT